MPRREEVSHTETQRQETLYCSTEDTSTSTTWIYQPGTNSTKCNRLYALLLKHYLPSHTSNCNYEDHLYKRTTVALRCLKLHKKMSMEDTRYAFLNDTRSLVTLIRRGVSASM